jgi:hypothetical protein
VFDESPSKKIILNKHDLLSAEVAPLKYRMLDPVGLRVSSARSKNFAQKLSFLGEGLDRTSQSI